jgi:hypothetical protein
MADIVIFRGALTRIGIVGISQEAFIAQGFDSWRTLGVVNRDFIKSVCKNIREADDDATINAIQEYKLYALHCWVTEKLRQNLPVIGTEFTVDVAFAYAAIVRDSREKKDEKEDALLTKPVAFTKDSKWRTYDMSLTNYLGTKRGKNQVPLEYILRKNDEVAADGTVFATTHERLVLSTPHSGEAYDEDNGTVWALMKQLMMDGPGYAYISQFDKMRNARGAIRALREHYEGASAMSRTKADAYTTIKNATYKGETRGWSFEQFTTVLSKAYRVLEEYDEPVAESKKVADLLGQIESVGMMQAGVAAVLSSTEMLESFTAATNYLSKLVKPMQNDRNSRQISANESRMGGGGRGGRGGRGGGGRGGGGRGGRGGRGRGRGGGGRGNDTPASMHIRGGGDSGPPNSGMAIKPGTYTNAEWQKLSYAERDKVRAARSEQQGAKRQASGLRSEHDEDDGDEDVGNAGDQFASHQKKKSKKD